MVTSSLDLDDLLRSFLAVLVPMLADHCEIDVLEKGELRRILRLTGDTEPASFEAHAIDLESDHLVARVLRGGRGRVIEHLSDQVKAQAAQDQDHLEAITGLGLRSVIVIPLVAHGRTVGALTMAVGPSGRTYDRSDLDFAEQIAERAAMAMDNARRFQIEQEIASTLQQALVPDVQSAGSVTPPLGTCRPATWAATGSTSCPSPTTAARRSSATSVGRACPPPR